jgi:PAS domain S-box-containing protein
VNPILTAEGRELQIEWYDSALRDREGELIGLLAVGHDITERLRAETALRKRVEELRALNLLSAQVSASLSPQQVVEAALAGIVRSVDPDLSMIYLRQGEELLLQGVWASDPTLQGTSPAVKQVGQCLCGLAVAEGRAYYSSDIVVDPRCTLPECKAVGIRSFAALPLGKGAEVLGVLGVASLQARDFSQVAPFLEALAGDVAIGLQNALLHDELRQRAADLEAEVAERRRAEEQVRYQAALVENVSDAIISTDLDFRILSWNRAAERMYGWSAGEAIDRPVSEVLKTRYPHHQSAQVMAQFQAQGEWEGEAIQERKDGTPIHVLVAVSAIVNSAGERVGAVSINRDISERVQAEATLRRRVEELNALNDFGALVSVSLSLEQVTEASLSGIAGYVAPDLAMLYLQRGEKLLLHRALAVDPDLEDVSLGVERVGQCLCGLAAQEGRAVYSSDLLADPRCTVDACQSVELRSFAALPLCRGKEMLGVLGLASTQRRDWRHGAPFLEALASHVATSLQNALLQEALRQRTAG